MKTVLAFGDSLTWGSCPFSGARHPKEDRWPDAMAAGLPQAEVITEGLRGRTTAYYRAGPTEMRGDLLLPSLLHSHAPLDLVMIMLGTNDVYSRVPVTESYWGLRKLVEIVRTHPYGIEGYAGPKVMLIAPPGFVAGQCFGVDEGVVEAGHQMREIVRDVATEYDTAFFDASTVAIAEAGDGLHLEAHVSRALGEALQAPVAEVLDL